jgi:monofunctional biosynthetic peptidoglycan transglycosylase
MKGMAAALARMVALVLLCGLALQLYFLARIALMIAVDPQSTTFQRSEIWRLLVERQSVAWSQQWRPYAQLGAPIKRAVIASEDARFADHSGVEWDALEAAWERNQRAQARADKLNEQLARRRDAGRAAAPGRGPPKTVPIKIVGGSTITQQLAKNLFLSGERNFVRKGQEVVITLMLEGLLPKQRILEIYLNNVEWGEGLFGAQAAARHYFHVDADRLGALQAARLAVMLPAPKRFEKRADSPYVLDRAATIAARMGDVELP